MSAFFTSDTHFNHVNILKYTKRPWTTIQEMNEALIKNWNDTVKPKDEVWHLGDFCWCKVDHEAISFIGRLNGKKHFIPGNHDKIITKLLKLNIYQTNGTSMFHSPIEEITIDDTRITLCHYAMRTWNKSHFGAYQLYGHSHGSLPDDPNLMSMDVGVDCHPEYRPFSFDEIKDHMSKKTFKPIERKNK
jgi:calcineurin-like phosphoesterase family protein